MWRGSTLYLSATRRIAAPVSSAPVFCGPVVWLSHAYVDKGYQFIGVVHG